MHISYYGIETLEIISTTLGGLIATFSLIVLLVSIVTSYYGLTSGKENLTFVKKSFHKRFIVLRKECFFRFPEGCQFYTFLGDAYFLVSSNHNLGMHFCRISGHFFITVTNRRFGLFTIRLVFEVRVNSCTKWSLRLTENKDLKVVGSIPGCKCQQFFNHGLQKNQLGTLSQGNSNLQ